MNIIEQKKTLRTSMRTKRTALPVAIKKQYDEWICLKLLKLVEEKDCSTIHCFLPMSGEIDLYPLIQQLLNTNKIIIAPKTLKNRKLQHLVLKSLQHIETGLYNTLHPSATVTFHGKYDLILVPGLAFDQQKYRLGYGGGYYDTFLNEHPNAYKIGLAYPFQYIEKIPIEAHDVVLNEVIVPNY